ncbi:MULTISPECIES: hypothetical protein [Methylosinus]|uniref:Uncharacterized protein n=1 Tax=Methylosinus trichosporium (strain ATCC 35070 / NCIMB 11131 / UNIQEM 75 / OB3b) TaxID=595536 RepID=A0A2D2D4K2_METT3|nr:MULTISPECIES: hypothetical protein [Methylosinus]ATQ69906.1 hypothetical protein CQW49_19970 [Methylosinus trichosporium OB3b]OBS53879.1 hypothetical protein A8B73_03685 [Methylosinus sp. 3S-1]
MRLRSICVASAALVNACIAAAVAEPLPFPDDFVGRLEALALMETLNAELLAGRSATLVLEKWCADHHMAAEPKIIARVATGDDAPPTKEQRERLGVGPDEKIAHRRVALTCGAHTLSEADNWYVPARLTAEMNLALQTSETPFGKVVQPLQPSRRTFSVETLWSPLPKGWESRTREELAPEHGGGPLDAPRGLIRHRAIVVGGDGRPISEVRETYTKEILDFDVPSAAR